MLLFTALAENIVTFRVPTYSKTLVQRTIYIISTNKYHAIAIKNVFAKRFSQLTQKESRIRHRYTILYFFLLALIGNYKVLNVISDG